MGLFSRKRIEAPCTVEVSHTFESLHAHVELGGGVKVYPGDEVIVHGAPIRVPYGETAVINRRATVIRANWLERTWTRLTGDLEFMELCEFSFSEKREL
ncbi:MAG: hypothetical protein NW215_04380 [Hyphomicrobiales bacterium]|nr:hypothetical protein [Hyphomicrobiales bacterium]